jgi:hypothetical protein
MSWHTISGTTSGTLDPNTGLTVSGGCDTCSGSHYVNYNYSYYVPSVSGNKFSLCGYNAQVYNDTYILVYRQSESVPKEIKSGLVAWHSLDESNLVFTDKSGNNLTATGTDVLTSTTGIFGGAISVDQTPYGHIYINDFPIQQNDYMCSFWFKPTQLLTSGTNTSFTIMGSDSFYGDHFKDSFDYKLYSTFKGWTLLGTPVTCSAGYNSSYLRFQGADNGLWFGSYETASTLYFSVAKTENWDIETSISLPVSLSNWQTCGLILFDSASYLNYGSLRFSKKGVYELQLVDGSIPAMSGSNTPSPYVVSANYEYSSYYAWKAFDSSLTTEWVAYSRTLPFLLKIDCGSGNHKVIQGYRLYNLGEANFPRDWTFEGSLDNYTWVVLHTMVNQPSATGWTSWFSFSNTIAYRYYRWNISLSNYSIGVPPTYWVSVGSIQFVVKDLVPASYDSIYMQVRDLTYVLDSHVTLSGTYLIRARKRNNIVSFEYKNSSDSEWLTTPYYVDTSTWGSSLRIGLQSYNPTGTAPEITSDYLKFNKGTKPEGWGDPEESGRLLITYNYIDAEGLFEDRTDSRMWLQTSRDSFVYGTSTFLWEPDQWYLIQFGFKPNATYDTDSYDFDYNWTVNTKRERGLVVGSGTGSSFIIPSGAPFQYFDVNSAYEDPGLFNLDEVAHWNRWLTAEEILRMWSPISQISWHKTLPDVTSWEQVLTVTGTTASGSYAERTIVDSLEFNWSTQYQAPLPEEKEIQMQALSYRIQRDLGIYAMRPGSAVVNIIRFSSGWIAQNTCSISGNYYIRGTTSNMPVRDVRGDATIYIRSFDYPSKTISFYGAPRTHSSYAPLQQVAHDQLYGNYLAVSYDTTVPTFIYLQPDRNERRVSPLLDWYSFPEGALTIKDYGNIIESSATRVWSHHPNQGYNKYIKYDNFCFDPLDFKELPTTTGSQFVTASGAGWVLTNPQQAVTARINEGASTIVSSDYSATVGSGYMLIRSITDLDEATEILRKDSYKFSPVSSRVGSDSLELSTTSGVWSTASGNRTAPFLYTTIPSGITDWEVETKLYAEREGDLRGQYAGLMLTYENDPSKFYKFVASSSGIAVQCDLSYISQVCEARTGLVTDDVWMRVTKSGSNFVFSWSEDSEEWKNLTPQLVNLNTPLTSNNTPSPYRAWADSEQDSNTRAWKVFSGDACSGTYPYWQSSGTTLPHWVAYDCGQPTTVYYYQLVFPKPEVYSDQYSPKTFSLQASNDTVNWSTLDSRTNQYDYGTCCSGIMYQVGSPGFYRYYRLYVTAASTGTSIVRLGQLKLFGTFFSHQFKTDSNYQIGPVIISERDLHTAPYFSTTLLSNMTSNTAPSPLVASASYDNTNAWRAFSNSSYWQPSADPWTPQWAQIDFGLQVIIQGIRWYHTYTTPTRIELKGSNDLSDWTSLFYFWDKQVRQYYTYGSSYWVPSSTTTEFLRFSNYKQFRYYRFYIHETQYGGTVGINNLKFYGGQPARQEITPALTYANFDYFKVTASSGIESIPLEGDPWELLLSEKTAMNSSTNAMVTTFTEVDTSTHRLTYYPKTALQNGAPVYMRAFASDPISFKIDYDPLDSYLLLMISGSHGMSVTNKIPDQMWDASPYNHKVYSSALGREELIPSGYLITTTGIVYEGQCAINKIDAGSFLHTQSFPASYFNSDWTIDLWSYTAAIPAGNLFDIRSDTAGVTGDSRLYASWTSSGINLYQNNNYLKTFSISSYTLNSWQHFAIVKNSDYVYAYYKGVKLGSQLLVSSTLVMPTESGCINFLNNYTGYVDMLDWRKSADWTTTRALYSSSSTDEIWMFTPTDWTDLSVEINPVPDENSPVVIPVGPLPSVSGACPASGVVFEIVDDISGVYWDSIKIVIDNITVFSGGNNMCDYYSDRGSLTFEEKGQKDGEWIIRTEATVSGEVFYDGINRQLYPPGTVYNESGAWGRRFTYYVPDDIQLSYFDKDILVTITGTDSVGYGSRLDSIQPNPFNEAYSFSFISNNNINIGNFFLEVGESERIDILHAQGRTLYVDLWDSDYPETDIIEEESYLHFSDGVDSFVCSGTWFTTWTGTGGLIPSGMLVHRLHYDAGNYNWDGHRTMKFTAHAQNDNPLCHTYNEHTYNLLYGWHIFWLHGTNPPFEFDKKLPVFVKIKTQEYVPSTFAQSYMLWTAPARTHDFQVGIKALPTGAGNDLEVDMIAHSYYLQYSEEVEIEVYCQDRDGNEVIYTWTFRTEDEP